MYWITDEWVETEQTEDLIIEYVAAKKYAKVFPDPENASAIEALKKRGVNVRKVTKGKGSVVFGINTVRELLKQNRLRINTKCIKVIESFEKYSYKESRGNNTPDELPAHDFSDPLDAIRYALVTDDGSSSSFSGPKVFYPQSRSKAINFNKFS